MAKSHGANEILNALDQIAWVAAMNCIQNTAEIITLNEIIYVAGTRWGSKKYMKHLEAMERELLVG